MKIKKTKRGYKKFNIFDYILDFFDLETIGMYLAIIWAFFFFIVGIAIFG